MLALRHASVAAVWLLLAMLAVVLGGSEAARAVVAAAAGSNAAPASAPTPQPRGSSTSRRRLTQLPSFADVANALTGLPPIVNIISNGAGAVQASVGGVNVGVLTDAYGTSEVAVGVGDLVGGYISKDNGFGLALGGGSLMGLAINKKTGLSITALGGLINVNFAADKEKVDLGPYLNVNMINYEKVKYEESGALMADALLAAANGDDGTLSDGTSFVDDGSGAASAAAVLARVNPTAVQAAAVSAGLSAEQAASVVVARAVARGDACSGGTVVQASGGKYLCRYKRAGSPPPPPPVASATVDAYGYYATPTPTPASPSAVGSNSVYTTSFTAPTPDAYYAYGGAPAPYVAAAPVDPYYTVTASAPAPVYVPAYAMQPYYYATASGGGAAAPAYYATTTQPTAYYG